MSSNRAANSSKTTPSTCATSTSECGMGGLLHHLRHPRHCYVVCAVPRSGSNLLTDGLHATRRAGRPKQFFLRKSELEFISAHGLDPNSGFDAYVRGIVAAAATS